MAGEMQEQTAQRSDDWKRHILQTFVPFNALTEDHLNTLLRDTHLEVVCRGSELFHRGQYDNHSVYLLSGEVLLSDAAGQEQRVTADGDQGRFPLAHMQPRRHTATALTDCQVIRFDSDKLDAMVAWDQAANYIILDITGQRDFDEDMDWMLTLLKSNLFYKVPPMNIRQVLDRFEPVYCSAGEVILRQGELGDCCFFIKEGEVDVLQAPDEKTEPALVATLGVQRFFGEDALLNETVRNATIVMNTNGVLMRLAKRDFFVLLKQPSAQTVSFAEMQQQLADGAVLLDVRTQDEFEHGHGRGALNMPLNILKLKARMLDADKPCIMYCNSGRRSGAAAYLLGVDGYSVLSLRGGIDALADDQREFFNNTEKLD